MRRKDREMPAEFALGIADKCEWAVVSMIDTDGAPYSIPVSIVREEGYLFFHSAQEGKKTDCLRRDPRVCVTCVGDTCRIAEKFTTEFESAVIFGRAEEITEDSEKIHVLKLLCERHAAAGMKDMENFNAAVEKSLGRTAIWRIPIDEITGKRKKYGRDGKELKFGKTE